MKSNARILAGETIGTAILVLGGVGSAVIGDGIGSLGIAVAFGLSIMAAAVVVGHASGAHLNPAVSLAMVLARKTEARALPFYVIGQVLGATLAALGVWGVASGIEEFDATNNFFQNGWDKFSPNGYGVGAILIVEVVFTAIWVAVVLSTEHRDVSPTAGVMSVGATVALLHLVTMPIDNTGLNPARSLATAIFAGGDALGQLWAFILCPIIGAIVGVMVWLAVDDARLEGTLLFNPGLAQARDLADRAVDEVVEVVEDLEGPRPT